jgi:hypothetical protein
MISDQGHPRVQAGLRVLEHHLHRRALLAQRFGARLATSSPPIRRGQRSVRKAAAWRGQPSTCRNRIRRPDPGLALHDVEDTPSTAFTSPVWRRKSRYRSGNASSGLRPGPAGGSGVKHGHRRLGNGACQWQATSWPSPIIRPSIARRGVWRRRRHHAGIRSARGTGRRSGAGQNRRLALDHLQPLAPLSRDATGIVFSSARV